MFVSLIDSSIVHIWPDNGDFTILRHATSPSKPSVGLAAALACPSDADEALLLLSTTGILRRLQGVGDVTAYPSDYFETTSTAIAGSLTVLPVGDVLSAAVLPHSILVPPSEAAVAGSSAAPGRGRSRVVVCGSKAAIEFPFDNPCEPIARNTLRPLPPLPPAVTLSASASPPLPPTRPSSSFSASDGAAAASGAGTDWVEMHDIACLAPVKIGRLFDAVGAPPLLPHLLLSVTRVGEISILFTSSIVPLVIPAAATGVSPEPDPRRSHLHDPLPCQRVPVVDILQRPVLCVKDLDDSIVVVVGEMHALAVVYPDASGRVGVHRAYWCLPSGHGESTKMMHTGNSRATPFRRGDIILRRQCSNEVVLEHREHKLSVCITYNPTDASVSVCQDANTLYEGQQREKSMDEREDPLISARGSTGRKPDDGDGDEGGADNGSAELQTSSDAHGATLTTLLRGIEQLAARDELMRAEDARLDSDIASYTSAVMFVRDLYASTDAGDESPTTAAVADKLCRSSLLSIDTVAAADSPRLHMPSPLTGVECFVTASFENSCGVALARGWHLTVQLERPGGAPGALLSQARGADESVESNNPGASSDEFAAERMARGEDGSGPDGSGQQQHGNGRRIVECERLESTLGCVEPGERRAVSFPSFVGSHMPVLASARLCFRHPDTGRVQGSDRLDIEVTLRDRVPLDILTMSRAAGASDRGADTDTSHLKLAHAQVLHQLTQHQSSGGHESFLDNAAAGAGARGAGRAVVDKRNKSDRGAGIAVQPLSQRLFVPVPVAAAREALAVGARGQTFRSVLGGAFVISVGPASVGAPRGAGGVDAASADSAHACIVTVRAVPHVLHFVRAAVVRRLLPLLAGEQVVGAEHGDASEQRPTSRGAEGQEKNGNTNESSDGAHGGGGGSEQVALKLGSGESARRWRRSVVDAADRARAEIGAAETAVAVVRQELHQVELEWPRNGRRAMACRTSMLEAVRAAEKALVQWRRSLDRLWPPAR